MNANPQTAGDLTWSAVRAYLLAHPTRTAAIGTTEGTYTVTYSPRAELTTQLHWVENSFLRDKFLNRPRRAGSAS